MHDLVNECADGFPIEFATKPDLVGSNPRAAGNGGGSKITARLDSLHLLERGSVPAGFLF
jgi:hypothetical protein